MFELDVTPFLAKRSLSDDDFRREIEVLGDWWFHRFDFTNGVSTPGRDPSARKLHALALPDRLDGKRVIDIGAADGYFSIQCAARGADYVLATDELLWKETSLNCLSKLRYVKEATALAVEDLQISVERLDESSVGVFDIALFLGVLYHAPNMMMYLERLRSVTKSMAVIETLVDLLDVDYPAAAFYSPGALNNDSSNWWGPNLACVEEMLGRAGFRSTRFVGLWEANTRQGQGERRSTGPLVSGRAVWHAYV